MNAVPMAEKNDLLFPLWRFNRLRMATDGWGVTTLVGAHGCPLACRYCINPECREAGEKVTFVTPVELYELVKRDDLYFRATNGGVTFGGGEPLLHAGFIRRFRETVPSEWRIYAETSLYVPEKCVKTAAGCIDHFFVDVKDLSSDIYSRYTSGDVRKVLSNIGTLLSAAGSDRITVRLPLIPGYNSDEDRDNSERILRGIGVTRFDRFRYKTQTRTKENR